MAYMKKDIQVDLRWITSRSGRLCLLLLVVLLATAMALAVGSDVAPGPTETSHGGRREILRRPTEHVDALGSGLTRVPTPSGTDSAVGDVDRARPTSSPPTSEPPTPHPPTPSPATPKSTSDVPSTGQPTKGETDAPRVLFGILSAPKYAEKRDACRQTWFKYKGYGTQWKAVFLLAGTKDETLMAAMRAEQEQHGDLLVNTTFEDGYYKITQKVSYFVNWAVEQQDFEFDYVVKTDDDSFWQMDLFLADLKTQPRKRLAWAKTRGHYRPHRKPGFKWDMPYSEWSEEQQKKHKFTMMAGAGYLFSRDVAALVAEKARNQAEYPFMRLEDVYHSYLLYRSGVKPRGTGRFMHLKQEKGRCREDFYLQHYVGPIKMKRIWSRVLNKEPLCPAIVARG
eukprot:TRINITY_DN4747_c0_g3_i1.p1 TRINITY_DN4747_c0_g3~~TRINITY_DN4747_c0_g3_i1.p1  ORF type:complete len:412 (+),score=108.00 TRINITY_DN4747_c0_g3_i1:49-1236(+)